MRLVLAAVLALAGDAAAQWSPATLEPLLSVPKIAATVAVSIDGPLFPRDLWDRLPPTDPRWTAWLAQRLPGLNPSRVRDLTADEADKIMAEAVSRGLAGCDVFSDEGLRTDRIFFLSRDVVDSIFAHYRLAFLSLPSGETRDDRRYEMQGLVMGAGRVVPLYNLSEFEFKNPFFPDNDFKFRDPVVYAIQGPGDLALDNAWVHVGIVTAKISRFVNIGGGKTRTETNWGSRERPLDPIRRKTLQLAAPATSD